MENKIKQFLNKYNSSRNDLSEKSENRLIENNKNGEKILSRLLIVILFFISIKYSYILIQKYS